MKKKGTDVKTRELVGSNPVAFSHAITNKDIPVARQAALKGCFGSSGMAQSLFS